MLTNEFHFDERNLKRVQRNFTNPFFFKITMLLKVPLNFMTGMRIRELNEESCKVSIPFRWLNRNPFRSIFWAVLGMAAEMSCGALVVMYTDRLKPSVSIIVGRCSAEFVSKATDLTTFVCNDGKRIAETVEKALNTGEPQEVLCKTTGYSKAGGEVARFTFTWKMKVRESRP